MYMYIQSIRCRERDMFAIIYKIQTQGPSVSIAGVCGRLTRVMAASYHRLSPFLLFSLSSLVARASLLPSSRSCIKRRGAASV